MWPSIVKISYLECFIVQDISTFFNVSPHIVNLRTDYLCEAEYERDGTLLNSSRASGQTNEINALFDCRE